MIIEKTIQLKINNAIFKLFEYDCYLLMNDLNERTIAHKLAEYLQEEYPEFNVDCEYNKNIEESNGLKNILLLKEECEELNRNFRNTTKIDGFKYSIVSIYPDIIVHKRGRNDKNLLIIEMKKTTNLTSRRFDEKKLKIYTDNSRPNKLQYSHGLFINFETGVKEPRFPELIWYRNGESLT
ncbi:hypothetical protein [Paenibacillus nuruki]|uniref:hypothetical protein n=1 Tax=Paenibacillus nuruki TaxID=1886670 RepID=UPI002804B351|nr:hypothetical protein [Paenibacillus nuruki]CAJ1315045.1 DUF3883 domain-containing protein [Paenibacillus nuruki]